MGFPDDPLVVAAQSCSNQLEDATRLDEVEEREVDGGDKSGRPFERLLIQRA